MILKRTTPSKRLSRSVKQPARTAFSLLLVLLFLPASARSEPVTFLFTGQVGTRYIAGSGVTFPAEITNKAPVSGSVTYNLALTGTENSSALDFLGRYDLLQDGAIFQMTLNALEWRFASHPADTPGSGSDQVNSLYVQHGADPDPDAIRLSFWDVYPAQDSLPFVEAGESARALLAATDNDAGSSEITSIEVPSAVPTGWNWEGDLAYVDGSGSLTFGFKFSMDVVFLTTDAPRITRWRRLSGGDFELGYTAEPGFSFELESSTDLNTWSVVRPLDGGDGEIITTVTLLSDPRRFYRIKKSRQ